MSISFSERNRRHWLSQSKKFGMSPEASWGDKHMIALEIETIGKHLKSGKRVLDAGCGNGYSGFLQLKKRHLAHLAGVDICPELVTFAKTAQKKNRADKRSSFQTGDIRSLPFESSSFDAVYTTRVLINLPDWAEQKKAISECLRVTKRGGVVIFSEAFMEPYRLLNRLRKLKALPPLSIHDFNRYLEKRRMETLLRSLKLKFHVEDFSSIYYLGTRFLRELVTDARAYPGYSNPVNKIFYELEKKISGGGFGIQQLFVVRV